MTKFFASATIVVALLLCYFSFISNNGVAAIQSAPYFELNLDLPPEERWNGAVEAILKDHPWNVSFQPVLDLYLPLGLLLPATVKKTLNTILMNKFPENYGEMQSVWKQLCKHGNIDKMTTFDTYIALAFAYEIEHINFLGKKLPPVYKRACCGILSLPTDPTLNILHERNMDESPHAGRFLTLRINATKNGRNVWSAFDWLWITSGVETSQSRGGFTAELNYRDFFQEKDAKAFTWSTFMQRAASPQFVPVILLHRVMHAKQFSFDEALNFITKTAVFPAPFYTVMAGTRRRGAVLTVHYEKSRTSVVHLNDTSVNPKTGEPSWYLVQTNYDRDSTPSNDRRRYAAQAALDMVGRDRGGTELGVFIAISTYPVHNPDTMYTAFLGTDKDIEGYVRKSMKPDDHH